MNKWFWTAFIFLLVVSCGDSHRSVSPTPDPLAWYVGVWDVQGHGDLKTVISPKSKTQVTVDHFLNDLDCLRRYKGTGVGEMESNRLQIQIPYKSGHKTLSALMFPVVEFYWRKFGQDSVLVKRPSDSMAVFYVESLGLNWTLIRR